MPVGESIREVYVPMNPPTLVARSCQRDWSAMAARYWRSYI